MQSDSGTQTYSEQGGHSAHYTQYSDEGWKEAIITNVKAPKGMTMKEGYGLREGQVEMKMLRKFYNKLYLFQLVSLPSKTNNVMRIFFHKSFL